MTTTRNERGGDVSLIKVDAFQQALTEAQTIPDVKKLADQADLFRQWLKKQRAGREAINAGAEMMLRAERRLGEMLGKQEKNRGAATPFHDERALALPKLQDLGISEIQSHRWQKVANVPHELFEEYILVTKSQSEQDNTSYITREGLLRFYIKKKTSNENIVPLPSGKYNVIYSDPPWKYDNQIESWGPTTGREKLMHYTGLPIEVISYYTDKSGREIKECFADDAVLFLWVTNPFLEEGLSLTRNWQFEYKTNIVWVKSNLKRPGSGFWVRGRHELLYICSRGSFLPEQKGKKPIGSVMNWEDTLVSDQREHSRKPEEVYKLIESMYPSGKYLELFARNNRTGWESWGDEL